jgi:hypothetical protein
MTGNDTVFTDAELAEVFESAATSILMRFTTRVREAINIAAWKDPTRSGDNPSAVTAFADYILTATGNEHLVARYCSGDAIDQWQQLRPRSIDELADELGRAAARFRGGAQ